MVQELMAFDTSNPSPQDVGERLAQVKEKLAALENRDNQEAPDSSGNK